MTIVFQFPGQSSRYPGLLSKLAASNQDNRDTIAAASEQLGRDLAWHYRKESRAAFATNRDVQVGVFLANHLFMQTLERAGVEASHSLGLSLGEWNHLVHIEALSFEAALSAVEKRGEAYDRGPRGMMAAVFPMPLGELEEVVARARNRGVLEVVNFNSPRQNVIAGDRAAVDYAIEIIDAEYFVESTVIEKNIPMHSSLFDAVAGDFARTLETTPFVAPTRPYLPNCTATMDPTPSPERLVDLLSAHVCRPVRWRESIDALLAAHPEATLIEVGPKSILTNLLDRKWQRGLTKLHTDSSDPNRHQIESVVATVLGGDDEERAA